MTTIDGTRAAKGLITAAYSGAPQIERSQASNLIPHPLTLPSDSGRPLPTQSEESPSVAIRKTLLLDTKMLRNMMGLEGQATPLPKRAISEKFNRLKAQWILEQATSSRLKNVVLSIPYQNIIGMGRDALPLLLNEIQTSPYYWFWALERITEANPAADATTHEEMVSAWLEWARTNV